VGSFETWLEQDCQWTERNYDLVVRVFNWFMRTGDWPDIEAFQWHLDQEEIEANARDLIATQPHIPAFGWGIPSNIPLRTRHIFGLKEARTLLGLMATAVERAYELYRETPPEENKGLLVSKGLLEQGLTPGQKSTLSRLPKFAQTDWPTPLAGGTAEGEWTMPITNALVRQYKGVHNSQQFLDRQLQIIKEHCDEHDERVGSVPKPGPFTAFVVMPIGGEWSDLVHKFIKDAIVSFDESSVSSIRADEIRENGRIDDQVVQRIRDCDFIIADITHGNLNVFWELGFAYAFEKPCVLLRQSDSRVDPPFDIYVQRRVEYAPQPTEGDTELLKALIEDAVEKVKAKQAAQEPPLSGIFKG
jgi:nucleoside 2-deoxyribosyltransferase